MRFDYELQEKTSALFARSENGFEGNQRRIALTIRHATAIFAAHTARAAGAAMSKT